jgi:hypothetical protein
MEVFIDLVDGGAGPRAFQKTLGLRKEDIAIQMNKLGLYRQVVKYTKQIKELSKNRNANIVQINETRKELLLAIENWNNEQEDN